MADLGREVEGLQGALTQTRGELAELQTRHDTAMDKATMDIAALNAKHDAAVDQAAKERADLEAGHAAALDQAAQDAAALQAKIEGDLAQAKATHADELGQANSRIQALADDLAALRTEDEALKVQLAAETAALTALKAEDEALKVQLADETAALTALKAEDEALKVQLADTEKALSGVKADLDTATKAAADQKTALEQQIDEAKGSIAGLEKTLATERKQNEEARTAADQASRAALTYQRSLYTRFTDIGAKETEQGMLLRLPETEVQFPVSKATLPKGELPSLDRVATLLTDFPKLTARIEGHTDSSGRAETNLTLSQARAEAIKEALVTRGIPAERIEATGVGAAKPIADNATKAGSRLNRRVEIYIVETPE
jgi:outer membrane protein OmpA-like peptidoglycan-associated protein